MAAPEKDPVERLMKSRRNCQASLPSPQNVLSLDPLPRKRFGEDIQCILVCPSCASPRSRQASRFCDTDRAPCRALPASRHNTRDPARLEPPWSPMRRARGQATLLKFTDGGFSRRTAGRTCKPQAVALVHSRTGAGGQTCRLDTHDTFYMAPAGLFPSA